MNNTDFMTPPPVPPETVPLQPDGREEMPAEKYVISKIINTIWIYLGSQFAFSFVFSMASSLFIGLWFSLMDGYWDQGAYEILTNFVLLMAAGLSALCAILYASSKLHIRIDRNMFKPVENKSDYLKTICCSYALLVPLSLFISGLSYLLRILFGVSIPESGNEQNLTFWGTAIYFILAVIVAPILEEIVFRGIIFRSLERFSMSFAVVFSSLCFGILHMNLYQGLPVIGMGMVLAYMTGKTGSLRPAIAAHMLNNLISVLAVTFGSTAMDIVTDVLLIGMALVGFYIIFRNWKQIRKTFEDSGASSVCWKITVKRVSFWILVILFVTASLLIIFAPDTLI